MPITNGFRGGPAIQVDALGVQTTRETLLKAAARGADMRPAMLQIRELLIEGHKKQFDSQGAFLGTPWPDSSPETILRKNREGVPSLSRPMVASGDLQESLSGGKGGRSRVSKGSVSVGTSLFYAIFAISGAEGGRKGKEPARPPVGINEAQEEQSIEIMERHLLGKGR